MTLDVKYLLPTTLILNIKKPYKSGDKTNVIYKMITSDYLANGGDGLFFLSETVKREDLNLKLRDALLEYIFKLNSDGKKINGLLDERIYYQH